MAKEVKQFRFYDEKNSGGKNYPENLRYRTLASGSAFADYMPITQLGIQALPGTMFYLNNSNNPIVIGYTGIYELNLEGMAEITALRFDGNSLNAINSNANSYLIVDIIYEGEG